jgi:hypothetical protein
MLDGQVALRAISFWCEPFARRATRSSSGTVPPVPYDTWYVLDSCWRDMEAVLEAEDQVTSRVRAAGRKSSVCIDVATGRSNHALFKLLDASYELIAVLSACLDDGVLGSYGDYRSATGFRSPSRFDVPCVRGSKGVIKKADRKRAGSRRRS